MKNFLFPLVLLVAFQGYAQDAEVFNSREVDVFPFIRNLVCEEPGSQACFEEQIRSHISQNIQYPEAAEAEQLSGKAYVQFTISIEGDVMDIKTRSNHDVFADEARRITEMIPTLKPASKDGKTVAMTHSFPLDFTFPTEPIAFADVAYPPNFGVCKKAKDAKACLQRYFFDKIMPRITKHPEISRKQKRQSKFSVWARFYFEITADGEIQNISVVSNEPAAKEITERFITEELQVSGPAKNEAQEPILSSYLDEIRATAIKREKVRQ